MTRLQTEIARLYDTATNGTTTRTLTLALCAPAEWQPLARVWQGVQADWGWPAPAIAVNGIDAYELWFSLDTALPQEEAQRVLTALRRHYLSDIDTTRVRLWPGAGEVPPPALPPRTTGTDTWSAFVSPDLAAVFGDTPWLDIPPGDDAQADLLSRLHSTPVQAVRALLSAEPSPATLTAPASAPMPTTPAAPAATAETEARTFLLSVMHDPAVALALRIDAAKALLR